MKCENCRYFSVLDSQCRKKLVTGLVGSAQGIQVVAGFPIVKPAMWCGEYEERKVIQ